MRIAMFVTDDEPVVKPSNTYHISTVNTALVVTTAEEADSYMMDDAGEEGA